MRIALFVVSVAVAAPALAQRTPPTLPFAPPGIDYVEADCAGGIAGINEQVRVLANGRVFKVTGRNANVVQTQAPPGEVLSIWRKLDIARFERRVVRGGLYPPDGITCTLIRRQNGRTHNVVIPQLTRDERLVADLRAIVGDINALVTRATGPRLRPAAIVALPQR